MTCINPLLLTMFNVSSQITKAHIVIPDPTKCAELLALEGA